MRTSGRTALLPKPSLHRTGPGGKKKTYKKEPKGSLSLSLTRTMGSLLFASLDQRALEDGFSCYYLNKIEL